MAPDSQAVLVALNRFGAVIKGVLRDHLGIADRVPADTVFPDSAAAKPMQGLLV